MFVRFALEADLLFSADLAPDAIKACEELVEESNKTLFKKGVPVSYTHLTLPTILLV